MCYEFGGLIFGGAYTCIFQNFTVYVNSPEYGTDLPLSYMGHKISQIKWTFELFCTLHVHVVCNLAHFSRIQTFFKTSYNVPSQSHVIIWQLDQFVGWVGRVGWGGVR